MNIETISTIQEPGAQVVAAAAPEATERDLTAKSSTDLLSAIVCGVLGGVVAVALSRAVYDRLLMPEFEARKLQFPEAGTSSPQGVRAVDICPED